MQQVITFQSTTGARIRLCVKHRDAVTRDRTGQEHCQVYEGMHAGICDLCPPQTIKFSLVDEHGQAL